MWLFNTSLTLPECFIQMNTYHDNDGSQKETSSVLGSVSKYLRYCWESNHTNKYVTQDGILVGSVFIVTVTGVGTITPRLFAIQLAVATALKTVQVIFHHNESPCTIPFWQRKATTLLTGPRQLSRILVCQQKTALHHLLWRVVTTNMPPPRWLCQ